MPRGRFLTAALVLACSLPHAYAQDTRNVTEPRIPQPCATLTASLQSSGGKLANADEGKLDTPRIQSALDSCAPGKAVQLKAAAGRDSFLSGPLQLRAGVTLLVDGGVILFASRNPRDYDSRPGACGVISTGGGGCRPLIGGTRVEGAGVTRGAKCRRGPLVVASSPNKRGILLARLWSNQRADLTCEN